MEQYEQIHVNTKEEIEDNEFTGRKIRKKYGEADN